MPVQNRYPLTVEQILTWAQAYRLATGDWPNVTSGRVAGTVGETWAGINYALRRGSRGLPGGQSLPQLLAERVGARIHKLLPPLTEELILSWADVYHQRTASWPTRDGGRIVGTGETWQGIDRALRRGTRGLPGGSSLAMLLAAGRGVRHRNHLPMLCEETILEWADLNYQSHGQWPTSLSGQVEAAPEETWSAIDSALGSGNRGLAGGSSLARLLLDRRNVRHHLAKPNLTIEMILAWADEFHARHGNWPNTASGPVFGAEDENWYAINQALRVGLRGLPGGGSLNELLAVERGASNLASLKSHTKKTILTWADAFFRRHGRWPATTSGAIPEAPGETWRNVDAALRQGLRGLPGGSSLAKLLAVHRDCRNHADLPSLTKKKILAWADAYFERNGVWPTADSGTVGEEPTETWKIVNTALLVGLRGLPGGSSLAQLLARRRGVPRWQRKSRRS